MNHQFSPSPSALFVPPTLPPSPITLIIVKFGYDLDVVLFLFTLPDAHAYISGALDSKTWVASAPFLADPALPFMYAIAQIHECIGSVEFQVGKNVRCRSLKAEPLRIGLVGGCGGREFTSEVWVAFLGWIWETFPEIVRIEAEVHDFDVGVGGY